MKNSYEGITLIIPVYNEEELIVDNTEKLMDYLNAYKINYEIFLGNNGSTDSTLDLALRLKKKYRGKIKVLSFKNKGVGRVFKKAAKDAKYDLIVSVDMDLSIELNFIKKAIHLSNQYDILAGSKQIGVQTRSFFRKLPSAMFIFLTQLMLGLKLTDYSMAAKAYKKKAIHKHLNKLDYGSSYVITLIYFAAKENRKIIEIPVKCVDTRKSKFNILHESFYRFKHVFKLKFLR